jgi:hypothetical protein
VLNLVLDQLLHLLYRGSRISSTFFHNLYKVVAIVDNLVDVGQLVTFLISKVTLYLWLDEGSIDLFRRIPFETDTLFYIFFLKYICTLLTSPMPTNQTSLRSFNRMINLVFKPSLQNIDREQNLKLFLIYVHQHM